MPRKPKDKEKPTTYFNSVAPSKTGKSKKLKGSGGSVSVTGGKSGGNKHVNRTKPSERRTSGTQTKGKIRANVKARLAADKPHLKGKALKKRIKGQVAGAVKRKKARGMTITNRKKKDK